MILSSQKEGYVLVHSGVIDTIAGWVDGRHDFLEAGGILIGSYRGPHIEIVDCTTPMMFDRRKRTLFDRRDPGHQLAAMKHWIKSGGTDSYVGEWHTHPEDHPHYSGTDWGTWSKLMQKSKHPLVFGIAGWETSWWALGDKGALTEMKAHKDEQDVAKAL